MRTCAASVIPRSEVERRIRAGLGRKPDPDAGSQALNHLLLLSFLGQATAQDTPSFADNPQELARATAIAQHYASLRGIEVQYHVHPAFIPYLEIAP